MANGSEIGLPSWTEQMRALEGVGERLVAKRGFAETTEAERQDMYRLCLAMLSSGYLNIVYNEPERPVFTPFWNIAFNQGGPSPDYVYRLAPIEPEGVYRISGFRGTVRFLDFALRNRIFQRTPYTQAKGGPPTYDTDTLSIGADGYFSVILSLEKPDGYDGDWWKMDPTTQSLLVRSCACDWRNEIDPRISIERLDTARPLTTEQVSSRMSDMALWIEGQIGFQMELVRHYREAHGLNNLLKSNIIATIGGLPNQAYYDGIFEIEDDEALIIETDLPKTCRYWQILVADDRFSTVDWFNRQSSLNDFQAQIDSDGRFRAVISARDPGVPNWVDKGDLKWGIVQMRWNKASDHPDPTTKRIKLVDLWDHLPSDTPRVSLEERAVSLRARREAAQFRRHW